MDRRALSKCVVWIGSTLVLGEVHTFAQDSGPSTDELQKQTQHPVANLLRVPLPDNTNFPAGKYARVPEVLKIQPVFRFRLREDWNLMARWIAPVVCQPNGFSGEGGANRLGDLKGTFFFSPAKPHNGKPRCSCRQQNRGTRADCRHYPADSDITEEMTVWNFELFC